MPNLFLVDIHAPVAQLDRALPSGGRGQRFESSRARHFKEPNLTFVTALRGSGVSQAALPGDAAESAMATGQPTLIRSNQRSASRAGLLLVNSLLLLASGVSAAMQQSSNIFWSGHSLTDPPIPQMVAEISGSLGVPMNWNRHSMAGASMGARTRGRPPNPLGWDGYRQGSNRDTVNMDVIEEFRSAATVGGNGYNVLVVTEVHDFLYSLLRGDTVRLLRHYYERFKAGNPQGQAFFYQAWLNIYDNSKPQPWIDYERAAEPVWRCIATRINTSLAAESRDDRLKFIPAGDALAHLVGQVTGDAPIGGITAASVAETVDRLFRDTVHLTDTGSYYIALVSYAFINNQSPAGAWAPPDVDAATAAALQERAWTYYTDYQQNNQPLTLSECSALIRESFAAQFWELLEARTLHRDNPWYEALWNTIREPLRTRKKIREWQQAFAPGSSEDPLRFDAEKDASYWHPAP